MENIMVSVCCTTYNHEKYISECIEGILNQQTSFNYELIIHDDASTDHTQSIIKKYYNLYPDIIHPILQTENQFSKKAEILRDYVLPNVHGKYVAYCEGDDYWIDPYKLQRQVEMLERNADSLFCVHSTYEVTRDGKRTGKIFPENKFTSERVKSDEFINDVLDGYSFHTSSYMFRKKEWGEYITHKPSFRKVVNIGDVPYMLYFGSLADVCFVDRFMSCYRRGVESSWTMLQKSDYSGHHYLSVYNMLKEFDTFSEGKYRKQITKKAADYKFKGCVLGRNCKCIISDPAVFSELKLKNKMLCIFGSVFPALLKSFYCKRLNSLYSKKGY